MKIDAAAIFPTRDWASAPGAAASQPTATTPIAASSSVAAASSGVTAADFTGMTRRELLDWVNDQIKTGRMTLDESTPFVGMTLKISAATQQPVDIATDQTRENFLEKAQRGLEGALWRKDEDEAKRLRFAIDTMRRVQGSPMRVDMRA